LTNDVNVETPVPSAERTPREGRRASDPIVKFVFIA